MTFINWFGQVDGIDTCTSHFSAFGDMIYRTLTQKMIRNRELNVKNIIMPDRIVTLRF